jgi:hypothetical protein
MTKLHIDDAELKAMDSRLATLQKSAADLREEKRGIDAELQQSTEALADAETNELLGVGTGEAAKLRKRMEVLRKRDAEIEQRLKPMEIAVSQAARLKQRRELQLRAAKVEELRPEYLRRVTDFAAALDRLANANAELVEFSEAATDLIGDEGGLAIDGVRLPIKDEFRRVDWGDYLEPSNRNSRYWQTMTEVAEYVPAALPENHPALIEHRTNTEMWRKAEHARLQAEAALLQSEPQDKAAWVSF